MGSNKIDFIYQNNCITNSTHCLIDYIKEYIYKSNKIDFNISFIKESGVIALKNEFQYIKNNKIPIRILTGSYLNITEPSALYLLKSILGEHVDLRMFSNYTKSFHPKGYFFETEEDCYLFLGSSNLSLPALTYGVEWNYRIQKSLDAKAYQEYQKNFEEMFSKAIQLNDLELKRYSLNWKKPKIEFDEINDAQTIHINNDVTAIGKINFRPRAAQIEAVYELEKTRKMGATKGIVVASTGVGKTFIAVYDSLKYKKVLFVAHRQEILEQAFHSFKQVRDEREIGFYNASNKDVDKNVILASVQTISKDEHLFKFQPDTFDYIIIDEFHHTAANIYQKILKHFQPKFLLGLTATPHRLDNKDIFAYCDYNLVYEVDLFTAINKGWLVPFRYYGIYDSTVNYDNITYIKGKYLSLELEKHLNIHKRADLILKHYQKFSSKRSLAFCSSVKHADFMANYFNEHGVASLAVHSANTTTDFNRATALKKLKSGEIKVIFAVDIFNEGADIPSLDMVMFLRPTESPTVFLQQLGRGLRLEKDKKYLNVLDFIGNYKKVELIPFLLTGKNLLTSKQKYKNIKQLINKTELPDGCQIDFDLDVINMLEKYYKESKRLEELIQLEFIRIEEKLKRIPTRVDLLKEIDDDIYQLMKRNSKKNIFKDYISFINRQKDGMYSNILNTIAHDFIIMIENTNMTKLYKIPVFLSFYNNGNILTEIDEETLYRNFKQFFNNSQNKLDLYRDKSTKNFERWTKKEYIKLAYKNPVHFLVQSAPEFFELKGKILKLNLKLRPYLANNEFKENFIDAVEFRRLQFLKERLLNREKEIRELVHK